MAEDIWQWNPAVRGKLYNRQTKCSELLQLLRPIAVICWFSILLFNTYVASESTIDTGPSPDFHSHSMVKPRIYHARNKREITDTKKNEFEHEDILSVDLQLNGVLRTMDLWLNKDLIPMGYKQRRQYNGNYTTEVPQNIELCHYQGNIRELADSWVAVSTCRGLRGVIYDGENVHYVEPKGESLDQMHYLYKHRDLVANKTCGYQGTAHDIIIDNKNIRRKRAAEVIRGPYNANRQSRYVELVLVIDKKEYIALGENTDKVHHHCKDIANIINALFTPLNIFVALVGVEIWTDSDAITLSTKGDTTLADFLRYRREILVKEMPNDNAQLLTRIHFEDGVVGKALKGPICTYEFSGGVSMDHSNVIGLVAATVAHEMGHNFGMEHDSADCSCPEDRCIMASSSGSTGPIHWSSCSLEYLALAFEHGMDYCLRNKPKKLFDSPICGNGFVESGEQCDCGLKEHCDNPCCNATTCMLYANASCATGECCDLKTCRPKNAGTECRTAEHECDLSEYCTGQSEYCPKDVFKIDGEVCSMGKAFCYQGSCRTHNDQCKLLWGPSGSSSDAQCYDMNSKGTKHGNCGYNRLESSYIKCEDQNILCGMLHCKHLNERLEFGMESVAILSHSFINNGGKIIACRSAIVDLGLNQVDPGLAPDGAKCAPGKMCVNQKCMSIDSLKATVNGGSACLNNCGGNGVCNSLGHCHCNRGFRPPDCLQPGFGGSDDSGPAEDPNARNDFVTALYVIFLGIIPTIALVSLAIWYKRNNSTHGTAWKKEAIATSERGFTIKTIDRPNHQRHTPHVIGETDSPLNQDQACASLLPKPENDERYNNNNLFGQFKGFTLTPLSSAVDAGKHPEETNQTILRQTVPIIARLPAISTSGIKSSAETVESGNAIRSAFTLKPPVGSSVQLAENREEFNLSEPPSLPPMNATSTAKPLISSPILAATTCTSLDFVGPKVPTRPAPKIPKRPSEVHSVHSSNKTNNSDSSCNTVKEKERPTTLNRIASMLKPGGIAKCSPYSNKSEQTNSLPRIHHHKATKVIDKEILRNLEISNPIPQSEIKIQIPAIPLMPSAQSDDNINRHSDEKKLVTRAQSMRNSNVTPRPAIQTFGSMRHPNMHGLNKRPTSVSISVRPKSPPPPVPPASSLACAFVDEKNLKIPGLPGYQNPPTKSNQKELSTDSAYDDCMNLVQESSLKVINEELQFSDNIYAVIEDPLPKKLEADKCKVTNEYKVPVTSKSVDVIGRVSNKSGNSSSNSRNSTADTHENNMGLLSEIVSEISSRNFDSIYSASTSPLIREKQNQEGEKIEKSRGTSESEISLSSYINASQYKVPSSVYLNSSSVKFDSATSETSSGYLLPSAVNVPKASDTDDANATSAASTDDVESAKIRDFRSNIATNESVNTLKDAKEKLGFKKINLLSTNSNTRTNNTPNSVVKNNIGSKKSLNSKVNSEINNANTVPVSTSASSGLSKGETAPDVGVKDAKMSKISSKAPPSHVNQEKTEKSLHSSPLPPKVCNTTIASPASTRTTAQTSSLQLEQTKSKPTDNLRTVKSKAAIGKGLIGETQSASSSTIQMSPKVHEKNDIKTKTKNLPSKSTASKSNVASLQLKFEPNKTVTTNSSGSSTRKSLSGKNIGNNVNVKNDDLKK